MQPQLSAEILARHLHHAIRAAALPSWIRCASPITTDRSTDPATDPNQNTPSQDAEDRKLCPTKSLHRRREWLAASPPTAIVLACPTSAAKPNWSPSYSGKSGLVNFIVPRLSCAKTKSSTPKPAAPAPAVIRRRRQDRPRRNSRRTSMASEALHEGTEAKRPNRLQVGDPFMEKLLLEARLEAHADRRNRWHSGHGRSGIDVLHMRNGRSRRCRP